MQELAFWPAANPGPQLRHAVKPGASVYVPAPQVKQDEAAVSVPKDPVGQREQAEAEASENEPAPHVLHEVDL